MPIGDLLSSIPPTAWFIIVGLVGIIIVLGFSIATGAGSGNFQPIVIKSNTCPGEAPRPTRFKEVYKKSSYKLSLQPPAGPCPNGYTSYTDWNGMALCCASPNIDVYSRTCSASGAESVCAMSPGIPDDRSPGGNDQYPVCQAIARQQLQAASGKLCPRAFPNYASSGNGYKCCSGPLSAGGTDCAGGRACSGLVSGQHMFNAPSSCEAEREIEKVKCPIGTNLIRDMRGSSARTRDLTIPVCIGVQGNCISRNILGKLRDAGYFTDIDLDKNLINCDVYNKIYNERLWIESQAETKKSEDL